MDGRGKEGDSCVFGCGGLWVKQLRWVKTSLHAEDDGICREVVKKMR